MACLSTFAEAICAWTTSVHEASRKEHYGAWLRTPFVIPGQERGTCVPFMPLGCHPSVSAAHLPWERIKALALACLFFSSKQVHQAEYSFKQA